MNEVRPKARAVQKAKRPIKIHRARAIEGSRSSDRRRPASSSPRRRSARPRRARLTSAARPDRARHEVNGRKPRCDAAIFFVSRRRARLSLSLSSSSPDKRIRVLQTASPLSYAKYESTFVRATSRVVYLLGSSEVSPRRVSARLLPALAFDDVVHAFQTRLVHLPLPHEVSPLPPHDVQVRDVRGGVRAEGSRVIVHTKRRRGGVERRQGWS